MKSHQIKRLIRKHKYIFSKYGIRKLAIFGSSLKGKGKTTDIDILVEFRKPSFRSYIYLARELEKILKKRVDLVTLNSLSPHIRPYVLKEAEYLEGL